MSIKFTGDLPKNLVRLDPYVEKRLAVAAHAFAPKAEKYMKEHAPWTDRTSNARNGLTARPEGKGLEARIILAHGVDYGIWLEISNSGAYAIIIPSIRVLAPQFFKLAARLVFVDRSIEGA